MFGQEIRLSTRPVDPRDIFRGDYVTLSFSIEQVDASLLREQDRDKPFTYLYVRLRPDEKGIWQPDRVSLAPPVTGIYIRALAEGGIDSSTINLDYGDFLKRYYVKENTGLELERAARRGELTAVVKVWRGRVVITSLEMPD